MPNRKGGSYRHNARDASGRFIGGSNGRSHKKKGAKAQKPSVPNAAALPKLKAPNGVAYINHIALVLDASGSMQRHADKVVEVADELIRGLAEKSKELDQETRLTVYTFADESKIACLFYDKDVLRMPSLKSRYTASGNTALNTAISKSVTDLEQTATLYGDHAFLVYFITDGQENASYSTTEDPLRAKLATVKAKGNWTLAAFVPDEYGAGAMRRLGFPDGNIQVWNTTSATGFADVGAAAWAATASYMTSRATYGSRSTSNLFQIDASVLQPKVVAAACTPVPYQGYRTLKVEATVAIAPFIESKLGRRYSVGEAYYQLTKPEKIQPGKKIALFERKTHKVFVGDVARKLLGLPDHEVRVAPTSTAEFDIFVQSTSVNRKLVPGTTVLVF